MDKEKIITDSIEDGAVTNEKLAPSSITVDKLHPDALPPLLDNSIDTDHLKNYIITNIKMANDSITTDKIADSNVTTDKIADSNVTTDKIADANVTTDKIADSNVTTDKIADSNVTTDKIADSNVTIGKIEYGAVLPLVLKTANSNVYSTIDLNDGLFFNITLNQASTTFTFPSSGVVNEVKQFWIYLKQDGVGGRAVTWDSDVRWAMNIVPNLDTTASTMSIFRFTQLGNTTRWYGECLGMGYNI